MCAQAKALRTDTQRQNWMTGSTNIKTWFFSPHLDKLDHWTFFFSQLNKKWVFSLFWVDWHPWTVSEPGWYGSPGLSLGLFSHQDHLFTRFGYLFFLSLSILRSSMTRQPLGHTLPPFTFCRLRMSCNNCPVFSASCCLLKIESLAAAIAHSVFSNCLNFDGKPLRMFLKMHSSAMLRVDAEVWIKWGKMHWYIFYINSQMYLSVWYFFVLML